MRHRSYEEDADDSSVESDGFDSPNDLMEHFQFSPVVETGRVHDVVFLALDIRFLDLEFFGGLREVNRRIEVGQGRSESHT
jgi:hypothetical protein